MLLNEGQKPFLIGEVWHRSICYSLGRRKYHTRGGRADLDLYGMAGRPALAGCRWCGAPRRTLRSRAFLLLASGYGNLGTALPRAVGWSPKPERGWMSAPGAPPMVRVRVQNGRPPVFSLP